MNKFHGGTGDSEAGEGASGQVGREGHEGRWEPEEDPARGALPSQGLEGGSRREWCAPGP